MGTSLLSCLDVRGLCVRLEAFLFSEISSLSPTEQWQQGCRWLPLPRLHTAALRLSDTTDDFPSASGTARLALTKLFSSPEPWLRLRVILGAGQDLVSHASRISDQLREEPSRLSARRCETFSLALPCPPRAGQHGLHCCTEEYALYKLYRTGQFFMGFFEHYPFHYFCHQENTSSDQTARISLPIPSCHALVKSL